MESQYDEETGSPMTEHIKVQQPSPSVVWVPEGVATVDGRWRGKDPRFIKSYSRMDPYSAKRLIHMNRFSKPFSPPVAENGDELGEASQQRQTRKLPKADWSEGVEDMEEHGSPTRREYKDGEILEIFTEVCIY